MIPFQKSGEMLRHLPGLWVWGCRTQFHSFQKVDNRTHSRAESDTWAASSRALQRFKQLRMLHGCKWSTMTRQIFYGWVLQYDDAMEC